MNDTTTLPPLPDRLSIDPRSPFHNAEAFEREVGIKFNDKVVIAIQDIQTLLKSSDYLASGLMLWS